MRGLYDAYDRGAETALLLDFNGNVAEGPGFNVFCVDDGGLSTPAVGVLPGITRRTVFDLCAEAGLAVAATDVSVAALRQSDEVFITSTAGGIMPVTMIDGVPVADRKVGAITRRLMAIYWQKHGDPAWCSPVHYP